MKLLRFVRDGEHYSMPVSGAFDVRFGNALKAIPQGSSMLGWGDLDDPIAVEIVNACGATLGFTGFSEWNRATASLPPSTAAQA